MSNVMNFRAPLALFLFLSSGSANPQVAPQRPPASGGVQAEGTQFQYIRSVSGSKGAPDGGKFVMEDPRTVFYIPADHEIIVYMEWNGPVGKHHIEGFWKNPDGKVAALNDFDYEAKDKRFGAYWTLALSPSAQIGMWTLEARIDGEQAGIHAFQVLAGTLPTTTVPVRHQLRAAQLYERALKSSVMIEKLDSQGERGALASGFLLEPGLVVTAFEVIDGATKVRVTLPGGRVVETDQVIAWDRRKDWAILKADVRGLLLFQQAPGDSWNVGDQVNLLGTTPEGTRVITTVAINGKSTSPTAGPRVSFNSRPPVGSIGTPLLNDYGEVVGIVVGTSVPGASALQMAKLRPQAPLNDVTMLESGSALPINAVHAPADLARATPFDQLLASGQFVAPVPPNRDLSYGQLAHSLEKKEGVTLPIRISEIFSKKDAHIAALVMWEGHEKRKGLLTVRIYDADNQLINTSWVDKPTKLNLNPGSRATSSWEFDASSLPPGFYRLEVWLDDTPAWRTFFRMTE